MLHLPFELFCASAAKLRPSDDALNGSFELLVVTVLVIARSPKLMPVKPPNTGAGSGCLVAGVDVSVCFDNTGESFVVDVTVAVIVVDAGNLNEKASVLSQSPFVFPPKRLVPDVSSTTGLLPNEAVPKNGLNSDFSAMKFKKKMMNEFDEFFKFWYFYQE